MCVRGQWYIKGFDKFSARERVREKEKEGERENKEDTMKRKIGILMSLLNRQKI